MIRYQRQTLLPQIGQTGQTRLAAARVLLVGCGALGTHIAEQLARAGAGFLRIVDRDIVELSNLQRQVLFDESHVKAGYPKALAAAERLAVINSEIRIDPHIVDLHAGNIESLIDSIDLILDGTDNVATRYLLNDAAINCHIPWVYGACVGVEGRVMAIRPGQSPCLRCIFPHPPRPEELATCDTAGVLGSAAAVVASLQVVAAIKMLTRMGEELPCELLSVDLWSNRFHAMPLNDARRADCPCCGLRQFEFLSRSPSESAVTLCGRDAVQVRGSGQADLSAVADRWSHLGTVERHRFFLRCHLAEPANIRLTLFGDGRLIVQGTRDGTRAKSLYARFVGA